MASALAVLVVFVILSVWIQSVESQGNGTLLAAPYLTREAQLFFQIDGVSGAICNHEFGREDAAVACVEINFPRKYAEVLPGIQGFNYLISNVDCHGTESRIRDCNFTTTIDPAQCSTTNWVKIRCHPFYFIGHRSTTDFSLDTYSNRALIVDIPFTRPAPISSFIVHTRRANCSVSFQVWTLSSGSTWNLKSTTDSVLISKAGFSQIRVLGSEQFKLDNASEAIGFTDLNSPACVTFELSSNADQSSIYVSGNNQTGTFANYRSDYAFNFGALLDFEDECTGNPCNITGTGTCYNEYMTHQCPCTSDKTGPDCQYTFADVEQKGACGDLGPELDIVFLLEDSFAVVNDSVYNYQLETFRRILYSLYILPRNDKVRVAAVAIGDNPSILFNLDEFDTKYEMDFGLREYSPTGAMNYNHTKGMEKSLYDTLLPNKRPNSKGVIISFIYSTYSQNSDRLVMEAKARNIQVISISAQDIESSATECLDFIPAGASYDSVQKVDMVMERICAEPKTIFVGRNTTLATSVSQSALNRAVIIGDRALRAGRANVMHIKLLYSNCTITFMLWHLPDANGFVGSIIYKSQPITFPTSGFFSHKVTEQVMLTDSSRLGFFDHSATQCVSMIFAGSTIEKTLSVLNLNIPTSMLYTNYTLTVLNFLLKFSIGVDIDGRNRCSRCSPCMNNGTCLDTDGGYECQCQSGYNGTHCEENIDDCVNNLCSDGSNCTDLLNAYRCDCPPGLYGQYCELGDRGQYYTGTPLLIPSQESEHVIIIQGITIVAGRVHLFHVDLAREHCNISLQIWKLIDRQTDTWQLRYTTDILYNASPGQLSKNMSEFNWQVTTDDYVGFLDRSPDPCVTYVYRPLPTDQILTDRKSFTQLDDPTPGENHTFSPYQRVFSFNTYVTIDVVDDCLRYSHLCLNGATCVDQWNYFSCTCPPGFSGDRCQDNIDDCALSPCLNRATCVDLINGFRCDCAEPYNGTNCQLGFFGFKSNGNRVAPVNERNSVVIMIDRNLDGGRLDSFHFRLARSGCKIAAQVWRDLNVTDGSLMLVYTTPLVQYNTSGDQQVQVSYDRFTVTPDDKVGFLDRNDVPCMTYLYTFLSSDHLLTDWQRLEGQPDPRLGQNITFDPYQRVYSFNFGALIDVVDDCAGNQCHSSATCVDLADAYGCQCPPDRTGQFCQHVIVAVDICFNVTCPTNLVCVSTGTTTYTCQCPTPYYGINCTLARLGSSTNQALTMDPVTEVNRSIIITGIPLKMGNIINFMISLARANCHISFQIWNVYNLTLNQYQLTYTSPLMMFTQAGLAQFSVENISIPVDSNFRYGFLDRTSPPCVTYTYITNPSEQVQTEWYDLQSRGDPNAGEILAYQLYQRTYSFNFQVEIDADDNCVSVPCMNNATCMDMVYGYRCLCAAGWTGNQCQQGWTGNQCQQGNYSNSLSMDMVYGYRCLCAAGWTGNQCQQDEDNCLSEPCMNNATCTDLLNGYRCQCAPGWTGNNCGQDEDDCVSSQCTNNATCVDLLNGYRCQCAPGWTGNYCQQDEDDCVSSQCTNNATCIDLLNGYRCQCAPGWTGNYCQQDEDDCVSSQCMNNATCIDLLNGYRCQCAPGWTGNYCQQDEDDCVSSQCINNATCIDLLNGYRCQCAPGWIGNYCQQDEDDCVSSQCINNATCIDLLNGYRCQCPPGWTGNYCQQAESSCISTPCMNNATCIDIPGAGYRCKCLHGWSGDQCQDGNYGFDIRNLTVLLIEPGEVSVVMQGVDLPHGYIVGFQLSVLQPNCRFRVQLWRHEGGMDYTLTDQFEKTYAQAGVYRVNLQQTHYMLVSPDHKLGFTSLSPSGACIAYSFVTDPASFSVTRRYIYSSTAPLTNQTYSFMAYQSTNRYGILAQIQEGVNRPPERIIVINQITSPGILLMDSVSEREKGVILTDTPLVLGHLLSFQVSLVRSDCDISFHIWRLVDQINNQWNLVFATPLYSIPLQGTIKVDVRHFGVGVTADDRLGFLDRSNEPCITYSVTTNTQHSTVWTDFINIDNPRRGDLVNFTSYQQNFAFDLAAEIDTQPSLGNGSVGLPGVQGETGSVGDTGEQGIMGSTGLAGERGVTGNQGVQGVPGPIGLPGIAGQEGDRGELGFPGPSGLPGSVGDSGDQGDAGLGGSSGGSGLSGGLGPSGPPGIQGVTGDRGDQGSRGPSGDIGLPGIRGIQGPLGDPGVQGLMGVSGDPGVRGEVGGEGPPGSPGQLGDAGVMWDPFGTDWCAAFVTSCQHGCVNDFDGGRCTCRTGYQLTNDNQCLDIDECSERNGLCQYICQNSMGSYTCSCPEGYTLSLDHHRCNDVNECTNNNGGCGAGQICVNLWGGHQCLGPYGLIVGGIAQPQTQLSPLVTDSMMIGLFVWMVVITIILILDILLCIKFLFSKNDVLYVYDDGPAEKEIAYIQTDEPYYPKFFPRISMEDYDGKDWDETSNKRLDRDRSSRIQTYDTVPYSKVSKLRRSGDFYFYGYPEN